MFIASTSMPNIPDFGLPTFSPDIDFATGFESGIANTLFNLTVDADMCDSLIFHTTILSSAVTSYILIRNLYRTYRARIIIRQQQPE